MYSAAIFSILRLALLFALLVLSLTVRSFTRRRVLFLPICALACYNIRFAPRAHPNFDNFVGLWNMTAVLFASDYLLLTNAHKELSKKGDTNKIRDVGLAPFAGRLKWAVELVVNPRGVGWIHGPPRGTLAPVPDPQYRTKSHLLLRIVGLSLFLDLASIPLGLNPAFHNAVSTTSYGLGWRCISVYTFLVVTIPAQILPHDIWILLFGGKDSPPWFGSFLDAYSVRSFWCRTWHQNLRRALKSHNRFIIQSLGIQPGSQLASFVSVYYGFLVSGLMHQLGGVGIGYGTLKFFCAQSLAITVESRVITLVKSSGVKVSPLVARTIGYIWVITWFSFCAPVWLDEMCMTRMLVMDPKSALTYRTWMFMMSVFAGE